MMYTLSPSIYASDYMEIRRQIRTMERVGVEMLHVDIMDGNFVPNLSFGKEFIRSLRSETKMLLDVHLMVKEPGRFVEDFAEAGADIISVHYEACQDAARVLEEIRACGLQAGAALKPETSVRYLPRKLWDLIDVMHIMTVRPGMNGQNFILPMLDKITEARERIRESGREIHIEVDGDITTEHLVQVLEAGADIVVVGKALFQGNLEENLRKYLEIGQAGMKEKVS